MVTSQRGNEESNSNREGSISSKTRNSTSINRERLSPWDKHNVILKVFLLYMIPIVYRGHRKRLHFEEIKVPPNADRSKRLATKLKEQYEIELIKGNPSLTRALFKTFWPNIALSFLFDSIAKCILAPMQIIALGWIIRDSHLLAHKDDLSQSTQEANQFFGTDSEEGLIAAYDENSIDNNNISYQECSFHHKIIVDAILLIFLAFTVNFSEHLFILANSRTDVKYRVACGNLVYQKALRLSKVSLAGTTAGQMVNLLSNDVNRFEELTKACSNLITAPAQTIIVLIILSISYLDVNSTLAGLATVGLYMILQTVIGRAFSRLRLMTARRTDRRVLLINEIIVAIRVIKMYAWEEPFKRMVQIARRRELNMIGLTFILRTTNHTLFLVASKVVVFALLITYVLTGNSLNGEVVFVTLGMGNLIRTSLTFHFPNAIATFASALISCRRLNNFLLLAEIDNDEGADSNYRIIPNVLITPVISSRNYSPKAEEQQNVPMGLLAPPSSAASSPGTTTKDNKTPPTVILFNRVKAAWSLDKDSTPVFKHVGLNRRRSATGNKHFALPSLSFSVKSKELITVIGRVGSGKSSLLLSILGELPIQSGRLQIKGRLSYAPQEAWIFPGTVRENILMGKPFRAERYNDVVQVCSLKRDLSILIDGDMTYVGDRGVSLSGGQRARVNLARALYHEADIYVLDDPLSAVDAPVSKHIFNEAILNFLSEKTVILATHQLQFLRHTDKVLVLERDQSTLFGTVEQLRQSDKFKALNFAREAFEEAHEEIVRENEILAAAAEASDVEDETSFDSPTDKPKERKKPEVIATQKSTDTQSHSTQQTSPTNQLVVVPAKQTPTMNIKPTTSGAKIIQKNSRVVGETSDSMDSNWGAYLYYIFNSANVIAIVWFIVINIIAQVNLQYVDYFLSLWTHSIQRHEFEGNSFRPASYIDNLDNNQIAIWYAGVIGLCLIVSYIRTGSFFLGALIGSNNIHRKLFDSFLNAPVSFYDFKPIGILLNRVSRDIGYVDEMMPNMMLETISSLCFMCGIFGVTIFIDLRNALGSVLLIIMAFTVRYFMARTIIRLKQLEGVARSPVFSHLSVTLNGLSVIRVFKIEEQFCQKFDANQDDHSGIWFHYMAAARFLSLSIDIFTFMFIATIIYTQIFVWFDPMYASFIGLTLTQVINLPVPVRRCMKTLIELDSYMTSVQRIKEFSDVTSEEVEAKKQLGRRLDADQNRNNDNDYKDKGNNNKLSSPEQRRQQQNVKYSSKKSHEMSIYGSLKPITRGRIKFRDVTLKYLPDEPPVLRNLSFTIEPGENIGIVGRTGAGKSSIMAALFRLYPFDGKIEIDGYDIKQMSLRQLRSAISIIPQEPILFVGSLRKNLDPFGDHSDFELWASLEAVKLDGIFSSSGHGLEFEIQESGANLSVGQRQLICLARAILRRNKILVLDEATANVDQETDAFIQQTIKQQFAGCTVVTVAHRLLTIVNSDRVLVMDGGQLREFDEPYTIVQQPDSLFNQIIRGSQGQHGDKIVQLIRESYERRNATLNIKHRF